MGRRGRVSGWCAVWACWIWGVWRLRGACCNERKWSVAGGSQSLDLPPFQGVKGVAGDVGFAVVSGEGIAEVDNT
jgi:hypothetical protein